MPHSVWWARVGDRPRPLFGRGLDFLDAFPRPAEVPVPEASVEHEDGRNGQPRQRLAERADRLRGQTLGTTCRWQPIPSVAARCCEPGWARSTLQRSFLTAGPRRCLTPGRPASRHAATG